MKMEQTERSETLAFKLQTPGNNPEESVRHSKQGEILKSRIIQRMLIKCGILQFTFKFGGQAYFKFIFFQ
jgi:hypothetical protein